MQHDLFWSLRDLDLRPNFDLDLQGQIIYLSKHLYERTTMMPSNLIKRRVQKLSIGIICVLAITVPDATARYLKNIKTSIEL